MRLIEADTVISVAEGEFFEEDVSKIRWLISHIPTAYDIDKVVEELQESASRHTKKYTTPYGDKGYKDVKAISVNKAVEIVRAGK